ncbi:type II secretion system ATPase GspE [Usitatibacter palustris]|uniref:type II secretion system ATPase GspE n=1 Tax=Usitatibacter palustris TaxID=2732487 RepID=UPI001BB27827|nr:type II secretion system ATPase GspE [Usitatibacter palustris]
MPQRIGEILVARGKLDTANLDRALKLQEGESREKVGMILLRLGMVSGRDLADALASQLDLPLASGADFPELPLMEERISAKFLRDAQAVPLREDDEEVAVAIADPTDSYVLSAMQMASGKRVRPYIAAPNEIEAALERLYGGGRSSMGQIVDSVESRDEEADWGDIEHLKDMASEAPVIRLVNLLFTKALESRASDIHIEPFENRLVVRYRIDGVLHEIESPPRRMSAAVISRVKIMASLDIAERRLPQDGRIKLRVQGKEIDLRVSTVPTMHGESVVMRILDKGGVPLDFASLGFEGVALEKFLAVLDQPHGILLVTGPTGSGKTTTLYTALDRLNKPDVKIVTVEDPVEYQMPGINQIQVKPQIDLTFASALRSIVRQDPDIIMVGEIRDVETVRIAMQSALTGHMVISTVHTNDAPATVSRLLDMGAEDYLLTSTVTGILAQRLVRTLCSHCREKHPALPEVVEQMQLRRFVPTGEVMLYKPVGCAKCAGTGYFGRLSIVEMLVMTDTLRSLIMRHATSGELRVAAISEGMETMFENGLRKALAGDTTIEEVLRVTRED